MRNLSSNKFLSFFLIILISVSLSSFVQNDTSDFGKLKYFPEIPIKNQVLVNSEEAKIGRYLFYDPILRRDSSFSCSSCHQQKFSFGDSISFSKGLDGELTKRNTMPLFNLLWYEKYFWDGRANTIEEQAFEPLQTHSEMDLNWLIAASRITNSSFYKPLIDKVFGSTIIDSNLIVKLIGQFERTLISQNSKFDRVVRGETSLTKKEYFGFELMNDQVKGKCLHCHTTDQDVLGTIGKFKNNGLVSAEKLSDYEDQGLGGVTNKDADYGKFKVPSIRNLGFSAPYMHDGRFKTLKEVLDFYDNPNASLNVDSKIEQHLGGANLNEAEKEAIIAFLNTLNDSSFISSSKLSNPFALN